MNQLAIGRYLTTSDARFFKEMEVHVTVNVISDISGTYGHVNDVYLFPGTRFGLDNQQKWYAMAGVQVPVTGPQPFGWQMLFAISRTY